jgi:hypothetical protein
MSSRAIIVVAALSVFAPKMPEQCNKVMGKGGTASASAEPPPPPPPPPLSATAPPIYVPPELNPAGTAPTTASAVQHKPSPAEAETIAAKAAIEKKKYKDAKSILDKKMKNGSATNEDVTLLHDACEKLKDGKCLAALAKLPNAPLE